VKLFPGSFLEDNLKLIEGEYEGKFNSEEHWGGYIVTPIEVEFWQGRPNRLHDRIRYVSQNDCSWKTEDYP
jgi:pyridoxamine 5'-phosphate oxidase